MKKNLKVQLPATGQIITEEVQEAVFHLPTAAENRAAREVEVRFWGIEKESPTLAAMLGGLLDGSEQEREIFMAAILNSVWEPGKAEGKGQRLASCREFQWRDVVAAPDTRKTIGLDRKEVIQAASCDDHARGRLEQIIVTKLSKNNPDLVRFANEAFAPGGDDLLPQDMETYHALLHETAKHHEMYKDKYGERKPRREDGSEKRYKNIMQRRLKRFVERKGWSVEEMNTALWWAAVRGNKIRPDANVLILEALAGSLDSPMRVDEKLLFDHTHVIEHPLQRGVVLYPVQWDRRLRSLWLATSFALRERIIYVHTQPPSMWPPEWKEETDRAIAAYLQLYKLVTDEIREKNRRKKAGKVPRPVSPGDSETAEETLERLRHDQGFAQAEVPLGEEVGRKDSATYELLRQVVVEVAEGALLDEDRVDFLLDAQGDVATRLAQVLDEVIKHALARSPKALEYLRIFDRVGSVGQVAREAGCKRSNVTRRLDHAVLTTMDFVEDLPSTRRLLCLHLDELGLGDRLLRLVPSMKKGVMDHDD